jgi:hypothetical protein
MASNSVLIGTLSTNFQCSNPCLGGRPQDRRAGAETTTAPNGRIPAWRRAEPQSYVKRTTEGVSVIRFLVTISRNAVRRSSKAVDDWSAEITAALVGRPTDCSPFAKMLGVLNFGFPVCSSDFLIVPYQPRSGKTSDADGPSLGLRLLTSRQPQPHLHELVAGSNGSGQRQLSLFSRFLCDLCGLESLSKLNSRPLIRRPYRAGIRF